MATNRLINSMTVVTCKVFNEVLLIELNAGYIIHSLIPVPRLLTAFQHCIRKTRESGKTYHAKDVAGGTDLHTGNSSQAGSTCYITCVTSFTRFPCLFRATSNALHTSDSNYHGNDKRVLSIRLSTREPFCHFHVCRSN